MREFLSALGKYVVSNTYLSKGSESPKPTGGGMPSMPAGVGTALGTNLVLPFELNVLVDNRSVEKLPIIIEPNPNWGNPFGRIERRAIMGTYVSDHGMLKPGAAHLANGSYLVLNARDVLMAPGAW